MQGPPGWNRRDLIKAAAAAAPALATLGRLTPAALALARPALGLEPPPAERTGRGPLKVIVAGAGLAGLAAAYELVALGAEVTVLEARMRPGGRVYTLRQPFADGLYAEAGGMDFADGCRHFQRYVKVFDLPTAPLPQPALATVYHLRGKRLAVKPAAGGAHPDWPFRLTPEEAGLGIGGMFAKFFAPIGDLDDPADPAWKLDPWKKFDAMTLAGFMARQGASSEVVELLTSCLWFGYGAAQVSALHRLLSDVALFCLGQTARVIAGGSDLLPQAFARALGGRIRYGAPLVRVSQQVGSVRVVHGQGGAEQSLEADRLICTLPCPALRGVRFAPELPGRKLEIFERLDYNPVTRIFLQVRRRVWQEAGASGVAFTDLPIQMVQEQPLVRGGAATARGIIECHVKGPEARRVAALDPAAQLAFAAEHLEKVYPGIRSQVETGAAVAWGADPWAGGGYAWWKPGQLTGWVPELARPEGRIHFAGEHTSWLGRTMEGALESGNRAAREVHLAPRPLSPLAD
jgi:monoamine oxidase